MTQVGPSPSRPGKGRCGRTGLFLASLLPHALALYIDFVSRAGHFLWQPFLRVVTFVLFHIMRVC